MAPPAADEPLVDPGPARRPAPVTLRGRFGRIEKLDAKIHAASLWSAFAGRDALWTYMPSGPFLDAVSFTAWLTRRAAMADPFYYAVVDSDGQTMGLVGLMKINPAMRVIEDGPAVYAPAMQRTPLAIESQYLLARYIFEDLGYRRYEARCNVLNVVARRAILRWGFSFEGVLRQHMIIKGRNRDSACFAMLDRDWPVRRAAFERSLNAFEAAANRKKEALSRSNGVA
jgi:RimJ/RimL family protein N-acetyltransferase